MRLACLFHRRRHLGTVASSGTGGENQSGRHRLQQTSNAYHDACRRPLSTSPKGFTASDLAGKVRALSGPSDKPYQARQAAYHLKKLRGKEFVSRIGNSRRLPNHAKRTQGDGCISGTARLAIQAASVYSRPSGADPTLLPRRSYDRGRL